MMRTFVCAALALLFSAGLIVAQEKKRKPSYVGGGTVKKIDAASSTIIVMYKRKDAVEDKEFKIGKDVKLVVHIDGRVSQTIDGFKVDQLKEGDLVRMNFNQKGDVVRVLLYQKKKKDG